MTETKKFKTEIKGWRTISNDYYIVKIIDDRETLRNIGNTDKFIDCIIGQVVVVNSTAWRVKSENNPHIAKALKDAGVDNWRIDGGTEAFANYKNIKRTEDTREYLIDIDAFTCQYLLARNERVCKSCGKVVKKNEIHGKFCKYCLLNGLAKRFSYHSYYDGYRVLDKKIDTSKTLVFGAEIERDYSGNLSMFEENKDDALVSVCDKLYKLNSKDRTQRENVFMYDGSLQGGGVEWITFPASYDYYKKHKDRTQAALDIFKQFDFKDSAAAGNHIHINRDFFGTDIDASRFAAAKIGVILAENWSEFCAIAGRDIRRTSYTTKPEHKKSDNLFTTVRKVLSDECDHCTAVNLQHGATIEIRLWSAIKDASDLLLYLDITSALAIFAKKKTLDAAQKASVVDVCKYLTDKNDHLPEIIKRLKDKNHTKQASEVEAYLKEFENKGGKA